MKVDLQRQYIRCQRKSSFTYTYPSHPPSVQPQVGPISSPWSHGEEEHISPIQSMRIISRFPHFGGRPPVLKAQEV